MHQIASGPAQAGTAGTVGLVVFAVALGLYRFTKPILRERARQRRPPARWPDRAGVDGARASAGAGHPGAAEHLPGPEDRAYWADAEPDSPLAADGMISESGEAEPGLSQDQRRP
jgi:hypothetical protein